MTDTINTWTLVRREWLAAAASATLALVVGCHHDEPAKPAAGQTVRCAVIGGMMTTNFWPQLAKRFEDETGNKVEVVVSGNKRMIAPAMERGEADLITMHASDTMVNLVADGFAVDAQPWARNDHVIVGPADDPAQIRGMKDAGEAMRKLLAAKSPFVVHRGGGASEVLRAVLSDAGLALDDATVLRLPDDANQENVLELASSKHAYCLVGFIPFKLGKMQGPGMEVMVEGDPRLRRPYLVAVANPTRWPAAHHEVAQQLAAFLRSPKTQAWIAEFGRAEFGGHAPFLPVAVDAKP
jgi:tungstate transport system substrate-binding protein